MCICLKKTTKQAGQQGHFSCKIYAQYCSYLLTSVMFWHYLLQSESRETRELKMNEKI